MNHERDLRERGILLAGPFAMASGDDLRAKIAASWQRLTEKHDSTAAAQTPSQPPLAPQQKRQLKQLRERSEIAKTVDIHKNAPQAAEAEQAVLGAMLQWPETCVPEARQLLTPNHFYNPVNAELFATMLAQFDAGRAEKSRWLISFTQFLRDSNRLDMLGGAHYVTSLATEPIAPSSVSFYAQMLREKFTQRELIDFGSKLMRASYGAVDDSEVSTIIDSAESRIVSLRSLHGVNGAMQHDDAAAVLASEITLPPDVICGVLPRCGRCSIGGASKSYKTWILLDLAVSVTTETLWLGKLQTKKGRVLYVNFELQRPYFNKRIQALCDAHQIKIEPGMLTVWHLRGHIKDWPRLQRQIRPGQFDLIILDPVYKLLLLAGAKFGVRDENSAGHIALLLDELDNLSMRTGAATAFGAHFAKGDPSAKDAIDRVSGSGVWARDPDAIINFTGLNTEDCFAVDLRLRVYAPVESFAVRWEFPAFVADITLDPADLKQRNKGAAEKQHTLAELVELFERPMLTREICEAATSKMKISERTFYRLWDEGKADSAFLKCKDGKWKVNLKWITKQT